MSNIKNKRNILATIDQLRSRKSRPDVSRICKYMLACYKISPKETKADLLRCVKEKSIVKVDYKDNVSYRNAEKWKRDRRKSQSRKMSATGSAERRIITTAIASLVYQNQRYLENGLAMDILVQASLGFTNDFSSKQIEDIIHKEIQMGSLVKLPNGNIALGPADHDADSCDSNKYENINKMTSSANSSTRSSPLRMRGRPRKRGGGASSSAPTNSNKNSGVRVGERRKMAKKVFDPSDVIMPSKRKRGRPVGSLNKSTIKKRMFIENSNRDSVPRSESQASNEESSEEVEPETYVSNESSGGVCSVCLVQKSRDSNDRMVECRDCNNKAHLSCLQSGSGILKLHPDSTWQCPHCKTCVVCCETNDAGVLTVCSICADAYHTLCHNPRIPENKKAWDQWECHNCEDSRSKMTESPGIMPREPIKEINKIEPFLKPHEIERSHSKLANDVPVDLSIPDITYWSSNDVYEYFLKHLPHVAPVLKEQVSVLYLLCDYELQDDYDHKEMDGHALALAGRTDIVRGLGLQLGPALALYRIVVKLQTRKDDWTMCWG